MKYKLVGTESYYSIFRCSPKIYDDITSTNNNALNKLADNDLIENAWISQGSIKFRTKSAQNVVNTVLNPFASEHIEMSTRPIPVVRHQRYTAGGDATGGAAVLGDQGGASGGVAGGAAGGAGGTGGAAGGVPTPRRAETGDCGCMLST